MIAPPQPGWRDLGPSYGLSDASPAAREHAALAAIALGSLTVEASHLDGRLWPLAWLGIAWLAWGLCRPGDDRRKAGMLLLSALIAHWLDAPWHFASMAHYLPGGVSAAWRWLIPGTLAWVLPQRLPLLLGWAIGRRFRLPAWIWLPVGWMSGEAIWERATGFPHDAWLYSQYQNPLVLRAVGDLGWEAALAICLAIAAAGGQALVGRSKRLALCTLVAVAGLFALPPLATGDPAALQGVGAVHMANYFHPPQAAPAGTRLLVWPEVARGRVPHLLEGPGHGERLTPPFAPDGTAHLFGTLIRNRAGEQNALVALAPDGTLLETRAKRRLFPLTERALLGMGLPGRAHLLPGAASPVLSVTGRRVTSLVCVEEFDRALVAEGRQQGADLVAISANEIGYCHSPIAFEQMLAAAVFRAVEAHAPVVRSSMQGPAALIAADGRILATSQPDTDGVLTLVGDVPSASLSAPANGALASGTSKAAPTVALLYSAATPSMRAALPRAAYTAYPIEGFQPTGARADVVIIAGHSSPPTYLGRPAAEVARAVASFHPALVVLDTCDGASTPILDALAAADLNSWVVAPPFRIPDTGLVYARDFLAPAQVAARAMRVHTDPPFPLLRWRIDRAALARTEAATYALDPTALRRRLTSVVPPLVRMPLAAVREPGASLLVLMPKTAFAARTK